MDRPIINVVDDRIILTLTVADQASGTAVAAAARAEQAANSVEGVLGEVQGVQSTVENIQSDVLVTQTEINQSLADAGNIVTDAGLEADRATTEADRAADVVSNVEKGMANVELGAFGKIPEYNLSFEQGTLSTAAGLPANSNSRTRTGDFIQSTKIEYIEFFGGQIGFIYNYDEDFNFIGIVGGSSLGGKAVHRDISLGGNFKIVVRYPDQRPIIPSDVRYTTLEPRENLLTDKKIEDISLATFGEITQPPFEFEQGILSADRGLPFSSSTRVRSPNFIQSSELKYVRAFYNQEVAVFLYDTNQEFAGFIDYEVVHRNIPIPGYYKLLVRNLNLSAITPSQAKVTNWEPLGGASVVGEEKLFTKHNPPLFAQIPYGDKLMLPIAEKETFFEGIMDAYPATVEKELIGTSFNGAYDVNAYTLTPEHFTVTIAVTCHVHGNEKYNPLGFFGLLEAAGSQQVNNHEFLSWLRENVRWIIVPFVSPMGYVNHTRQYNGVDPNRNFDYWWSAQDEYKGTSPYSTAETQNIRDYFLPLSDEIDYHMDLHDVFYNSMGYMPFHNRDMVWLEKHNQTTAWLGDLNDVPVNLNYVGEVGCCMNFFSEVLGIPSTTPEHSQLYWPLTGVNLDVEIAKAAEHIAAFLCLFANNFEYQRGSSYYKKTQCRSFVSEEFGISTWSWATFHAKLVEHTIFSQVSVSGSKLSYQLSPGTYSKTILVVAGITNDDKNSSFVCKLMMELIGKDRSKLPSYVDNLRNTRLIFVPAMNQTFASESTLQTSINGIVSTYNPNYVLFLRGANNASAVADITASSTGYTSYTAKNVSEKATGSGGTLEGYVSARKTTLFLNNPIKDTYRYGYGVEKWLEASINDIASFAKEV